MKRLSLTTVLVAAALSGLGAWDTSSAAAESRAAKGVAAKQEKDSALQIAPGPRGHATIIRIRKGLLEGVPPPPASDPARIAAARPLVQLLGLREKAIASVDRQIPVLTGTIRFRNPKLTDAQMKKVPDRIRANAYATLGRLLEYEAHVLAQHYTVDQLKAIAAFYRSDAGKRLLSEEPKIDLEMGPVKGGWTFGYIIATNKEMGGAPLTSGTVVGINQSAKPQGSVKRH
jgi:hypothetical protein